MGWDSNPLRHSPYWDTPPSCWWHFYICCSHPIYIGVAIFPEGSAFPYPLRNRQLLTERSLQPESRHKIGIPRRIRTLNNTFGAWYVTITLLRYILSKNWWRISDLNRSDILGASEATTPSSPIPQKLAGNVGFEPTTHGLTVRCTTTVLIAIKIGCVKFTDEKLRTLTGRNNSF